MNDRRADGMAGKGSAGAGRWCQVTADHSANDVGEGPGPGDISDEVITGIAADCINGDGVT